ncbi:hypothetical protein [uncultured Shewanella sp.]|uniref:hypothetical protein n=1 Tax=uncultured Shewanella sp. TaxID=173975 RepID=UPI002626F469|nr:hypothetical protein [uncultured Shewanella sp.]
MRTVIVLLVLMGMLFSFKVSSQSCQVPAHLNGKSVLQEITGMDARINPEADSLRSYVFLNDKINDVSLITGKKINANYHYQVLAPNIAQLEVYSFKDKQNLLYRAIWVCTTNTVGYFIYTLINGEYSVNVTPHQASGVYIIQQSQSD